MNFGHGELGFGAWPRAKSKPVAQYCTVLSVSTPSAFDAPLMTAVASCAEGAAVASASPTISPSPARLFLTIDHRLSRLRFGGTRTLRRASFRPPPPNAATRRRGGC